MNPRDASALVNKGVVFQNEANLFDALACYDAAIAIDPRHAFAWNNKGEVLNGLKRFAQAIVCFDMALKVKEFASPWCGKGDSLRNLGRHEEAVVEYRKAVDRYGAYAEAWRGKALSEDKIGLKNESIDSYKKFIASAPDKGTKEAMEAMARLKESGVSEAELSVLVKRPELNRN
jgi:tetratricopeptide (TPR) repeat protein